MGQVPQWYRVLQAARYLKVPVWELETQPWRYVLQAEEAQAAVNQAATERAGRT